MKRDIDGQLTARELRERIGMAGKALDGRIVRDLLADIRHYCDAKDIDFHEELDSSYRHYIAERKNT